MFSRDQESAVDIESGEADTLESMMQSSSENMRYPGSSEAKKHN